MNYCVHGLSPRPWSTYYYIASSDVSWNTAYYRLMADVLCILLILEIMECNGATMVVCVQLY
jgi:hypothetical protein